MLIVGLMSGTSVDAIDAALVEVSERRGQLAVRQVAFVKRPFEPALRDWVFAAFEGGEYFSLLAESGVPPPPQPSPPRWRGGSVFPLPPGGEGRVRGGGAGPVPGGRHNTAAELSALNVCLGEAFAAAAMEVIRAAGLLPSEVDLIASHGQTISHTPRGEVPATLQLGEPSVIAEQTGVTTVADFRPRDIAAGGQGAPLVSFVDYLLFTHTQRSRAVQNIGGIANVTLLPPRATPETVLAFDTGPGNLLLDQAARSVSGGRLQCDLDGRLAAAGRVDEGLLAELLSHPFLSQRPPKTTGREEFGDVFGQQVLTRARYLGLGPEDTLATLTAFTAASIAGAYAAFARCPLDEVIVGGGGRYNPTLLAMLRQHLAPAVVRPHEDLGFSSDAKEAVAFAILGYLAIQGRPNNLPSSTGARRAVPMGKIVPGENFARLVRKRVRGE